MTAPDAPETPVPSLRPRVIGGHLLFSLLVLALFLTFLRQVWFPPPLYDSQDVQGVMNVLVVVFLALGPLLTAILFIPGKKGLALDMTVVGLLQLGTLGVSGELLFVERPAYLAFAIDRFIAIPASTLVQPERLRWPELGLGDPLAGPRLVFVKPPTDGQEATRLMMAVMAGKERDMEYRPQYYEPMAGHLGAVMAAAVDLDLLAKRQPDKFPQVEEALRSWGESRESVVFLPLFGKERGKPMLVGVRKADGMPVGGVRLDPWVGGSPRAVAKETSVPAPVSVR